MAVEEGRAAIYELDLETGSSRIFASGLRNPVGLAWEPATGALWTVVNERDGLGDETPPDYLTSVSDGGFYGWPYCYWGQTVDDRVPQDPAMVAKAITPDYALGGHTASLGLCWLPAGTLPGFPDGMVIGQHGSWNRSTLSGYRVVFVPFEGGRPSGPAARHPDGLPVAGRASSYGRPVGRDDRAGRLAAGGRRRRRRDLAGDRRLTPQARAANRLQRCFAPGSGCARLWAVHERGNLVDAQPAQFLQIGRCHLARPDGRDCLGKARARPARPAAVVERRPGQAGDPRLRRRG